MRNAVIYARVSTEEQAKEGQSLESQIRICERYAKDNDLDIVGKFVDEGKSATTMNRPALRDMLVSVQDKTKKIEIILVQDTDRLARNTIDHLQIKALLKKNGVQLLSVSQPIIDDSPEGNLVDTLLAATNAFQSQITGRKTSKVMEQKALMGWYPGGTPPLGYKNQNNPSATSTLDRRIIVQDPSLTPIMREVFTMYATGNYSALDIANYLNEKAIKSPTGSKIHTSLVVRTLCNPFYTGKFQWNGKTYSGKHDPIIDDQMLSQIISVMEAHNAGASRKRKHDLLLRGFLFCADCGSRFWGEKHEGSGKMYSFYFCKNCGKGSYTDVDSLEQSIENRMKKVEISDEYKRKVLELAIQIIEESRSTRDSEKLRLVREKTSLEKALRDAEDDRYIHHTIDSESFTRLSQRYMELLEKVKKQLNNLDIDHSEKLKSLERILALAENLYEAYRLADPQMKREYLGLFFRKFLIKEGKIVKIELSPEVKDLIEDGSVRVNTTGLRLVDAFCNHKIEFSVNLQLLQNFFTDWQLTPSFA